MLIGGKMSMMEIDAPWAPLGVMLSMFGSRINRKILFKYPFELTNQSQGSLAQYQQLNSSTYHLSGSNPHSSRINSNEGEVSKDEDNGVTRNELEQFLQFSDDMLGQIVSPGNSKIYGQKFDVKINGLRFVGFPLRLEENSEQNKVRRMMFSLKRNENQQSASAAAKTVLSLNVVFVLKTSADYSVVEAYQQLSAKIGIALRFEERRDNYVMNETKTMMNIHEDDNYSECSSEKIFEKVLKESPLAQNLKSLFQELHETGIIDFALNENSRVSFCLYQKVHNSTDISDHCGHVNFAAIEKTLKQIKPYHGLLVYDSKSVWDALPEFCSTSIVKFLNVYKPTKSLQCMSNDADITLSHVYTIAKHLVQWGKACIIYPLCDTNVYAVAPTAQLYNQSKWVQIFRNFFQMNLIEVLSHFSMPVQLAEMQIVNGLFFGQSKKLVEVVFWMLQHRFLVQHHTYVYFIPPGWSNDKQQENLQQALLSYVETLRLPITLNELPDYCKKPLLQSEVQASNDDIALFLKLLQYFDGKHHLEEMMYRENINRVQLLNILDKFTPVLLTCAREDVIASAFCLYN